MNNDIYEIRFFYVGLTNSYAVVPLRFVTLLLNCHEVNNFNSELLTWLLYSN